MLIGASNAKEILIRLVVAIFISFITSSFMGFGLDTQAINSSIEQKTDGENRVLQEQVDDVRSEYDRMLRRLQNQSVNQAVSSPDNRTALDVIDKRITEITAEKAKRVKEVKENINEIEYNYSFMNKFRTYFSLGISPEKRIFFIIMFIIEIFPSVLAFFYYQSKK